MEKRTILAIAMSFLILVAFDFAYKKYFVPEKPPQTAEVSSTGKAPVYESDYEPGALEDSTDLSVTEVQIPTPETDTTTDSLQEIVIESDLYRAVLSNQGAVL
jgi:YidC/Oxa1 family membrane protein insertase